MSSASKGCSQIAAAHHALPVQQFAWRAGEIELAARLLPRSRARVTKATPSATKLANACVTVPKTPAYATAPVIVARIIAPTPTGLTS